MLNPNHPDDERLSALASGDTDATADASLTAHLSTCDRCTDLVNELGALRASLAELPDLRPSRPLRLLPAEPAPVDRAGGWARRFFAPVLTAGAALAMVGLVGTATPVLDQMGSGGGDSATGGAAQELAAQASEAAGGGEPGTFGAPVDASAAPAADGAAPEPSLQGADPLLEAASTRAAAPSVAARTSDFAGEDVDRDAEAALAPPAPDSPWPMVLFAGVALMVAAGLLRWILVPRPPA